MGCMPDSVTKFKEDTPTKETTTSSSSGSSSSSDSSSETTSTTITSFNYYQQNGDQLILKLKDPDKLAGFTVGDTLYVSTTFPVDSGKGELSIVSIDTDRKEMLVSIASAGSGLFVEPEDFIDNCGTGFASCALGASSAAVIETASFYLDRTDTSASLTRTPTTSPASASDWVYSVDPPIDLGMSFNTTTGVISMPVVPFLAPELENEIYTITLTNGNNETREVSISLTTLKSNQFTLAYDYSANQRLVLEVEDASGFNFDDDVTDGNNVIYSCTSELFSACDADDEYVGIGEIYYVDTSTDPHQVFISIDSTAAPPADTDATNERDFYSQYYIHADDGSFSTQISAEPIRLFNSGDTVSLNATLTPATAGETYSTTPGLSDGLAINSSTGEITNSGTIGSRVTEEEGLISVVAKDSNGQTLASKSLRFRVVDAPTALSYEQLSPIEYIIGDDITKNKPVVTGLPEDSKTVYYAIDATLPSGLSFDVTKGEIEGTPVAYDAGTTYTISAYHPFSSATTFDTYAMNITTASSIASIFVRQGLGDKLRIEVSDITPFSLGENISTPTGAQALIDYIDVTNKVLFVTVTNAALTGSDVFKKDDNIDNTGSFVAAATAITKVVHEFKTTDDLTGGIASDIYDSGGSVVSLVGAETVSYSISPALPTDLTFSAAAGTITGNSASGQSIMNETEYTISVTNAIGETDSVTYNMVISETPTDVSVASLQYIPVNAVSNTRFFKGMFISSENGSFGKVIDLYENGSGQIEGIYAFFSGTIAADEGIDNETPYFSAETTKKNWGFVYVSAIDNFTVSGSISNTDDIAGTILAIAPETAGAVTGPGRLLVEFAVVGQSFTSGDSVDNAATFSAQEALVSSVSDKLEANVVLTIADSSNFPIGTYVSTDSGAASPAIGLVVFNDEINEKLFVRTISGQFADGDLLDNERTHDSTVDTIATVEALNLELTIPNDTDLVAGENATFDSGATHQAAASFNYDPDTSDTAYFVEVHSGIVENSDTIDDANPYVASEQTVSLVEHDHHFKGYVGSFMTLNTYVRGTVTEYSVSPSLPNGLTLDTATGLISGSPTENKTRTTYTITARNGAETATHTFSMAIHSQFRVTNGTANTSSYILRKQGQGNETTSCRVNSMQIDGSTAQDGINDIVCIMDAGEADLFYKGVQFNVTSSAGLCEYVNYEPYSFNRFPVLTSATTYYEFSGDLSGCTTLTGDGIDSIRAAGGGLVDINLPINEADVLASGVVQSDANGGTAGSPDFETGKIYCRSGNGCNSSNFNETSIQCIGDHSTANSDFPNCDEGSTTKYIYTITDDGSGNCNSVLTTETTDCTGTRSSCMGGPILDSGISDVTSTSGTTLSAFTGLSNQAYTVGDSTAVDTTYGYLPSSNVYWANFSFMEGIALDNSNFILNANNWSAAETKTSGAATLGISPIEGLNTNKFYTYECLDSSFNTKARIRIAVRDWDRDFAPNTSNYNTDVLDNSSGLVDDTSNECFGSTCDTVQDWDSLPTVAVSSTPADTVDITAGSANVSSNGGGGDFLTSLFPGYVLRIDGVTYTVESVTDNDNFVLTTNAQTTATGATVNVLLGRTLESVPDLDPVYVASFTASVTNGSATITASANVTSEIEAGSLINIAGYSYIVSSIAGDNVTVTLESDVLSATGAGQEVKIYMGTGAAITVAAADTVDLSKDSSIITSNGGTGSFTTEITVGSLVSIGGVIYTVRQVDSDDQFRVTVPAPAAATGATMTILRGIPFPMAR